MTATAQSVYQVTSDGQGIGVLWIDMAPWGGAPKWRVLATYPDVDTARAVLSTLLYDREHLS